MGLPSVSVAICTRDRPVSLEACVAAVCAQTHKPKELIVVDDGRLAPDVRQRLGGRAQHADIPWRYLRKTEPGLTRSRNVALAHSNGEIVQFFDDDAEPAYDYVREIAALFAADADGAVGVLGGTVIEPALAGPGGKMWRLVSGLAGWWALGRRGMRRGPWPAGMRGAGRVVATANLAGAALAVRRTAAWPPGFDESLTGYGLGEDRELAYRLARTHLVGCATRARAVHHHDPRGRVNPGQYGHAAAHNYCYILHKNVPMGLGEWVVVLWGLLVLAGLRLVCSLALRHERERHLDELRGMIRGGGCWLRQSLMRAAFCW